MESEFPISPNQESHSERKPFFQFWRCFWLSFLVISLAYAWHCYYVPPNQVAWEEDYSAAQAQAAKDQKPLLLYFTGEWCVPCRIMKRQVWADEQVAASVNADFIPVAIDVGNPDVADVMARYHVLGSPVTVVTDPHGNVMRWRDGRLGKPEFLQFLKASNASMANES